MKSSKAFKILWIICLAATSIVGYIFSLKAFRVPNLILIEFSCTAKKLCYNLEPYVSTTLDENLKLDFVFILCYSLLFYFSVKMLAILLELKSFKLMWLCFLPGFFDIAENMYLLPTGCCNDEAASFSLFFYAVRLKWLLCIPYALLSVIIAFYLLLELADKTLAATRKKHPGA